MHSPPWTEIGEVRRVADDAARRAEEAERLAHEAVASARRMEELIRALSERLDEIERERSV